MALHKRTTEEQKAEKKKLETKPVVEAKEKKEPEAEPKLQAADLPPDLDTLNDAAELIINQLEGRGAEILREAAYMQTLPIWMHVVGLLQRAVDTGEHNTPVIDPAWSRKNSASVGFYGEHSCDCGCGIVFNRRWPGQIYATNECGIRASRAAGLRSPDKLHRYAVGEEPRMAPRSTIFTDEAGSFDPRTGPPQGDGESGSVGGEVASVGD